MVPDPQVWRMLLGDTQGAGARPSLSSISAAVCGLGQLGTDMALALTKGGLRRLILIDAARVTRTDIQDAGYHESQLGRLKAEALADRLREISLCTEIISLPVKITGANLARLLGPADIICEAFHDPETKTMLVNGVQKHFPEKCLVVSQGLCADDQAHAVLRLLAAPYEPPPKKG